MLTDKQRGTLDNLSDFIRESLRSWDPCDNAADFVCRFCGKRPSTNGGEIQHREDCQGFEYIRLIEDIDDNLDGGMCNHGINVRKEPCEDCDRYLADEMASSLLSPHYKR